MKYARFDHFIYVIASRFFHFDEKPSNSATSDQISEGISKNIYKIKLNAQSNYKYYSLHLNVCYML